jgi:phosphohistidine phosphatase SixA
MSMRLYLVQHGEARSEAEDPERSLTIRGEEETRKISGAAKRLGLRPSKIYHTGIRGFAATKGQRQWCFDTAPSYVWKRKSLENEPCTGLSNPRWSKGWLLNCLSTVMILRAMLPIFLLLF